MEASYYAQLPTLLLLSKELTCFQKLLYADIQSLTFQRGYCYASNGFLADRHDKSEEHISRQISKLITHGHLFVIDNRGGKNSAGKRKLFTESTFLLYAKEQGLNLSDFKIDKNIKVSPVEIDKNVKVSNISKKQVVKEVPKGTGSQSEQGMKSSEGSRKRQALKQTKKGVVTSEKKVSPVTVELVAYWNTFDTLASHNIKQKRTVAPMHEQTKTIQAIDTCIHQLLKGTFYSKHAEVPKAFKSKKFTVGKIKEMIDKIALANDPSHTKNSKMFTNGRLSFTCFFFNPYTKLLEGKNKYRVKYPFVHFYNNDVEKVEDAPVRKSTEYEVLVGKTLKMLKATTKPTDKQYNQVVVQIEKAMVLIKKKSNGNLAENRMRLPTLLRDTMMENSLELTVQDLPLGVYNLEKFMRKRLMIQ